MNLFHNSPPAFQIIILHNKAAGVGIIYTIFIR